MCLILVRCVCLCVWVFFRFFFLSPLFYLHLVCDGILQFNHCGYFSLESFILFCLFSEFRKYIWTYATFLSFRMYFFSVCMLENKNHRKNVHFITVKFLHLFFLVVVAVGSVWDVWCTSTIYVSTDSLDQICKMVLNYPNG